MACGKRCHLHQVGEGSLKGVVIKVGEHTVSSNETWVNPQINVGSNDIF
jgi:hypothetical protein